MESRSDQAKTDLASTATLVHGQERDIVRSGPAPSGWTNDLAPIATSDWSYDRAAHLIDRTGFGAPPEEIARLAAMTPEQAVMSLLDYQSIRNDLPPFDPSGVWDPSLRDFPP